MSLIEHAKRELKIAGLLDKDSDYNGGIGKAVLELIKTLAKQGHSGASANLTVETFYALARFKPLTPITSDPKDWAYIENGNVWQNIRSSNLFSKDGGKTWYDVEVNNKNAHR